MSGPPDAMARWAEICHEADLKEDEWIERLRAEGVKAAHPDDGWVDREADSVHFAYAGFNDGVKAGDRIALGWPDKYRIVTVVEIKDVGVVMPMRRYFFSPNDQA
ncbi:MAG: hypothetical protein AAGH89_08820 [Verrucomicrobiota bacterium]